MLFIASCLGRFMPRALNKTERKKCSNLDQRWTSNMSLKAELAVSEASDNFTTNLVLHIFMLFAHCAHNVPFFFNFIRINCWRFCVTGLCHLLAFSQDNITLWPISIISHMIDHVKYIVWDKFTSLFSLILNIAWWILKWIIF